MSYVARAGYLAIAPVLHEDERGEWTSARVIVHDSYKDGGEWVDGPSFAYHVLVTGAKARALCAVAARHGNIGVMFAGSERVTLWTDPEGGAHMIRQVRADMIAPSFGQELTMTKADARRPATVSRASRDEVEMRPMFGTNAPEDFRQKYEEAREEARRAKGEQA